MGKCAVGSLHLLDIYLPGLTFELYHQLSQANISFAENTAIHN